MMMLWFDRHRRLRDRLSAYIDGGLDASAAARLEAHLAECERCRAELEQLRATVAALRDMPQADLPRSFVLSPERAAARRPRQPAPALAFGMRIAAAGVAVALAAVLVADLGDFGGVTEDGAAPAMIAERQAGEAGMEEEGAEPAAGDLDETLMSEREGAETPAAGGAAEAVPEPEIAETPAPPEEAEQPAAAPSGGGIDALTAAEIGLAAALGVLVAGGLVLALAGRKR